MTILTPPPTATPVTMMVVGPASQNRSANGVLAQARHYGFDIDRIEEYRLFHLAAELSDSELELLASRLLVDRVGQWWERASVDGRTGAEPAGEPLVIEVGLRPGVTDRQGAELVRAARELGIEMTAASVARRFVIHSSSPDLDVVALANQVLHNPVVERWSHGSLTPAFVDPASQSSTTQSFELADMSDAELIELSAQRCLGLSLVEMKAIAKQFRCLGRPATDGEIETLAQTWSEHCSHKTFTSSIETDDGVRIDGLMATYLKAATTTLNAPWVRSAFVDNAGIIEFEPGLDLAIKAETHNHPSALEPFGGANTGVGGVVRDILGVSAQPIAITDILCFGPEDLDPNDLPVGVLHPRRVKAGVVAGVGDYGNKIGVPTVAGAVIHDPSYTTTPLVFAGCVGVLPTGSHPTTPHAGDAIVVLGGAVGRDGIGGATFSSQTMEATSADVAGSSVQIGDPVVEKGLIDVVLAARDQRLYNSITDCGAGGLSSAVGEMADPVGARVDLGLVPRKYPGLAPWEVWLSEAQERMVLAVPDPRPVLELARRWSVDAAVIGYFTGTGLLEVVNGAESVVDLDLSFVHQGRPPLQLKATLPHPRREGRASSAPEKSPASHSVDNTTQILLDLLAHPSIRSNESLVRTFDHEVLGGTLRRPYGGVAHDGPGDGAAVIPPGSSTNRAVVIGIGASVVLGRHDPEAMAWAAVDEAVANAVACGANPNQLSLLDNFSWGDPTDPETLGQLVLACRGCHDAALSYGAPYVSGKDSLFNVFVADGQRHPVTPTLIITAVGVADCGQIPMIGVGAQGNDVWLIGPAEGALGGSHYDDLTGIDHGGPLQTPDPAAIERHSGLYQAIGAGLVVSAHDISHGGLAVAAAEWALAGRLGLTIELDQLDDPKLSHHVLFGEGPGRYLVEVATENRQRFEEITTQAQLVGQVVAPPQLSIGSALTVSLAEIESAFSSHQRPPSHRPNPSQPEDQTK